MGTRLIRTSKHAHELDFIGDHLAIDFVNTVRAVGGEVTDTLRSDGDVRVWLGLAAVPVAAKPSPWPAGTLLEAARRLRESDQGAWAEILHLGRLQKPGESG